MKLKFFSVITALILLISCAHHKADVNDMISGMQDIRLHKKDAVINILWYQGSDTKFHYFKYVYSMTGVKRYKVPKDQLFINENMTLTGDSTSWIPVMKIDGVWFASRKYDGLWVEDKNGIDITVAP